MKFYVYYDVYGEIGARRSGPWDTSALAEEFKKDIETFDDVSNARIEETSDETPSPICSS